MNDTVTARPGQVWASPSGDLALVATVGDGNVYMRDVTGPHTGEIHYRPTSTMTAEWRFHSENARLRCLDHESALVAAKFLTDMGMRDVLVDGEVVSAPLTAASVMSFAEDAFEQGWAHDGDCARMIEDLG